MVYDDAMSDLVRKGERVDIWLTRSICSVPFVVARPWLESHVDEVAAVMSREQHVCVLTYDDAFCDERTTRCRQHTEGVALGD